MSMILCKFTENSTGRTLLINPNTVVGITSWLRDENYTEIHTLSGRDYIVYEELTLVEKLLQPTIR